MNRPTPDSSPAGKIQAALDEQVARRRHERHATSAPTAPRVSSATPLPGERRPIVRWVLLGLLAVTVHAAGIYWYAQSKQSPRNLVLVVEPTATAPVADSADVADLPGLSPALSATGSAPAATASGPGAQSSPQGKAGVIEHNGKVIVVPASTPSFRPSPARTVVATAPAPSAPSQATAATHVSTKDHAAAAKEFAYYHFRYKHKVGSANYAVTAQSVRIERTEEIASWNRYRSTGEAGLEYYDNSGFRRTTCRFEVLTEDKDGQATALEITVK